MTADDGHCEKKDNYSVMNTIDKARRCTALVVRYKNLGEEYSGMSNKKKLLIYAHYYIPDTASTGQILRELAEGMLDKFDITVICVVPSYLGTIEDKYKTQKYYEEEINGVKVLRIRVPEFSKTNKKSRVKNIVSYFFGAMGATFKVGKMDYVFSISQPPILGGECEIIRGCHNRDKGTAENERLRNPKFIFSYPKNERLIFLNGRNAAQEEISTMRVG